MKTPATNHFPAIEWEITREVIERDPEEREVVYLANGTDQFGLKYIGSAHYVCGEFEGIKSVELAVF